MAGPASHRSTEPPGGAWGIDPDSRATSQLNAEANDDNRSIVDAYGDVLDSDDEGPQQSVLGEALGGSRPSTAMQSPYEAQATPTVPEALWSTRTPLRSQQQHPLQTRSPTAGAGVSPMLGSPEVVYAEAYGAEATPNPRQGPFSSPLAKNAPYQARVSGSAAQLPPLGHSTPPGGSSQRTISASPRSSIDSGTITPHYNAHAVSDPELDLIDSYDLDNPSRPTSVLPGTGSVTDNIVDGYGGGSGDAGGVSRMSSIMSHASGVHKRTRHQAGPDTPEMLAHSKHLQLRSNSDLADQTSITGMYMGYDDHTPLASPSRGKLFQNYAPGVGDMSEPDHSVVSFPDQSTDQFILPPDYQSQVFVGDTLDQLHGADQEWDERKPRAKDHFSVRGFANVSTMILLVLAVLMLFLGYPVLHTVSTEHADHDRAMSLGRDANNVPKLQNMNSLRTSLIDPDTPMDVRNRTRYRDGKPMVLVFSDEFNQDGRSFYPGEDPFWQAEDLHYWQTKNYEWYDPESIKTEDGNLVIKLSQKPEHNLHFRGGLVSSWNKFCFTGGYIEVSVQLPGFNNVSGLWPAAWTMGNLGRAAYGASTEGLWPYSYDSCDVGTLENQTYLASQGGGPIAAETSGRYVDQYGPQLSFLPGQRLSRCTCPNADHPGPKHPDGTWVGRAAPEIDIFEALASNGPNDHGQVSMSYQVAPFDDAYNISTANGGYYNYNDSEHETIMNDYNGNAYQESVSTKVNTTDSAYQLTGGEFDQYGYEYEPGTGNNSYITWTVSQRPMFTVNASAIGANPRTEIGPRLIPEEPMYIIFNLGIASSFTFVNWDALHWPAIMKIDYVRIWQEPDKIRTSCSPPDYPTKEYIERHKEAYYNKELTSWTGSTEEGGYGGKWPGNMLLGQC